MGSAIMCRKFTHQLITRLGRVCRELAALSLIVENVSEEDAVVYTDGSVLCGGMSGWVSHPE